MTKISGEYIETLERHASEWDAVASQHEEWAARSVGDMRKTHVWHAERARGKAAEFRADATTARQFAA